MTLPLLVKSTADVWGTERDHSSSELPLSTFSPVRDFVAEDYDSLIAELNRLEEKCQALKMRISALDFAPPVEPIAEEKQ